MSSVLAIVVTFHPDQNLALNLNALSIEVDEIILVDNGSASAEIQYLESLVNPKVHLIKNIRNLGVGEGFSQGMRWGLEKGFSHFLLMDQDSRPVEGMVQKLRAALQGLSNESSSLVLVGPAHEDFDRKLNKSPSEDLERVELLITSGSLVSRQILEKIGFYDERLFIDHVDHDFCLRLIHFGGSCYKVNSARMLHRFGEAKVKSFLGKSFFLQEYSPFRRYHMMRNRIVLYKRFGMFSGKWFWLDVKVALKDLIKLVLFEGNKLSKLTAVAKGFWDGLRWKDR
jgi:rhamnosyltransferase